MFSPLSFYAVVQWRSIRVLLAACVGVSLLLGLFITFRANKAWLRPVEQSGDQTAAVLEVRHDTLLPVRDSVSEGDTETADRDSSNVFDSDEEPSKDAASQVTTASSVESETTEQTKPPVASLTFRKSTSRCQLCNNPEKVSIFFDNFDSMNRYFGTFGGAEERMPKYCPLPNGAVCAPQHHDRSADVVFKSVQTGANAQKFCDHQLLGVLNGEAPHDSQIMRGADIRVDHHPTSHGMFSGACGIAIEMTEDQEPPDPATRKGIALFLSNCGVRWRSDYVQELMKHIPIDSHGTCFHNVPGPSTRQQYMGTYKQIASKYRMVVTFENRILQDYISEKIVLAYRAGAIPVYWGPSNIYMWVPGNHTFIDASKYSPRDLAAYLKRINEDDNLYRYHTTNFDVRRAKEVWGKHCDIEGYMCQVCKTAYKKKIEILEKGVCG